MNFKKVVTSTLAALLLAGSSAFNVKAADSIDVWGMGEEVKQLSVMADKFTEETGIEVNIQAIPWDQAHDKLLTAVASKQGPDVLQMGTTWMPEFVEAGALADMAPYIEKHENLKPENFYEGSVMTTKFDDKTFGIPWNTETRVLFYRTDLLESVGFKEAPKTWEELAEAAKKLSERGENMYGINVDAKEQSLAFMYARQNGSKLFDEAGKPLFNQPEFVEAVTYLSDFIKNGYAPKGDLGVDTTVTFGGEGMVPMFISGPWMVKAVRDNIPDVEGKWNIAPLPKGKEHNGSTIGGSNLTIFEFSEKKDNAALFIEFMARPENQVQWMELTDALPTALKAWEDPKLAENEYLKVFEEQLKVSEPMPLIPEFEEIAQTYLRHFEQIFMGDKDVQAELDAFNGEAESILK